MAVLIHTKPASGELDFAHSSAVSTLFWMLPGPAGFLDHVAALLSRHRAVAVRLNERTVLGHQAFIDSALVRASFSSTEHEGSNWVLLRVHDASQIDCDIAQHLCTVDGRRQIGPAALAEWHTGRQHSEQAPDAPQTIVLRIRDEQAQRVAWTYLSEFVQALRGSTGNTRVILLRVDSDPAWKPAELEILKAGGNFEAASFDGALGPDEMSSYLGMRMAMSGFAGNSNNVFDFPIERLARSLIAEFAGFDAHFAEGLMRMSEIELLGLPQSLAALASRMPVSDTVWRQTSPELGTLATIEGQTLVHTLHQWHLASHAGPYQAAAEKGLARMKWRAYLSALMPWFEELRHALISELSSLLALHMAPTNGERVRLTRNGKEVRTKIVDLECNDINAMTRDEPKLVGRNQRERQALDLCFKVSRVRNEIAHLRPPSIQDVQLLIESLRNYRLS